MPNISFGLEEQHTIGRTYSEREGLGRDTNPSQFQPPGESTSMGIAEAPRAPLTVRSELSLLDERIVFTLQILDLHGSIIARDQKAVGGGAYSEVFRGTCYIATRSEVRVAIKRLRFHVPEIERSRVSIAFSFRF